ncbi:MAG: phosphatidylserine/phosphatidylglycerophosphate/cardiolipin synthase family protein, partial [Deltaproteobacteria bacterium]|nr:phosphatidylserine/phosphatidylglycerophosphate/cardiolipin synthase family protein [Deltaproteobacteria bacterium]
FGVRAPNECEVAILPGGEDSFAARMDLLARAKRTIRIQALIFTGDESGLRVAEVLKQRKREGVDVRIIVDAVNNMGPQTQWMYFDLKQHGIEVEGYEAMGLQLVNELPLPLLKPSSDPNHPNMRYHEKLWIIDPGTPDAEAVTGGLNIANEYFRVDPANVPRYWRDQDVLVRGAVLADLTTTFDRNWEHFKAIDASRGGLSDLAWTAARKLMAKSGPPAIRFQRRDDLVRSVAAIEARPVTRSYQPTRCRFFQSRPRLEETFIQQAYLKLLDAAKHEVLIANAYFLPTLSTRLAIAEAASRCVRVVILSNGIETADTPGMNTLARGYYKELLAVNDSAGVKACPNGRGVEIWEWLGKKPGDAKQTQGLYHAKYAVADRAVSLVGSYNLDPRSERLNSESAIVFDNAELAAQLSAIFLEQDLSTSRKISAQEAATFERPSSVRKRLKKELAELFEDQL